MRRKRSPQTVRPCVQRVIESITTAPAWVHNDRGDVLAANELGTGPVSGDDDRRRRPAQQRTFHVPEHEGAGVLCRLGPRSEEFRTRWARHDVKYHRTGRKPLHHPLVGDLDQSFEALELPADLGLRVNVYTADPDTPSEDALKVLASRAATRRETTAAQVKEKQ